MYLCFQGFQDWTTNWPAPYVPPKVQVWTKTLLSKLMNTYMEDSTDSTHPEMAFNPLDII